MIRKVYDLGSRELAEGSHQLEVTIEGANAKAIKRHMFGLDYLKLDAVKNKGP